MAPMHNPPHPASILREDVLPALGLTVSEAAHRGLAGRRDQDTVMARSLDKSQKRTYHSLFGTYR